MEGCVIIKHREEQFQELSLMFANTLILCRPWTTLLFLSPYPGLNKDLIYASLNPPPLSIPGLLYTDGLPHFLQIPTLLLSFTVFYLRNNGNSVEQLNTPSSPLNSTFAPGTLSREFHSYYSRKYRWTLNSSSSLRESAVFCVCGVTSNSPHPSHNIAQFVWIIRRNNSSPEGAHNPRTKNRRNTSRYRQSLNILIEWSLSQFCPYSSSSFHARWFVRLHPRPAEAPNCGESQGSVRWHLTACFPEQGNCIDFMRGMYRLRWLQKTENPPCLHRQSRTMDAKEKTTW